MIENKELKYVMGSLAIAFIWMVFLIPNLDSLGIGSDPYIRFLIFNIGIFILLQVALKAVILNSSVKFGETLGLLMIANGIDLLAPPFVWNTLGQASTNIILADASSDYIVGLLWQGVASGFWLYLAVYVLTPILLFIGAGLLLKNFVKHL